MSIYYYPLYTTNQEGLDPGQRFTSDAIVAQLVEQPVVRDYVEVLLKSSVARSVVWCLLWFDAKS